MKIEKINDWFAIRGKWIIKKRYLVLCGFVFVFIMGLIGLKSF